MDPAKAWKALDKAKDNLVSTIGIKTLDPRYFIYVCKKTISYLVTGNIMDFTITLTTVRTKLQLEDGTTIKDL